MTTLIVQWDGSEWQFDDDKFSLQQAIAIQLAYGFNLESYAAALQQADPRALQCMYWLMLQQAGVVMPIKEVDADIVELTTAWGDAMQRELDRAAAEKAAAEPEPEVPTRPAGPPSPERPSLPDTTPTPPGPQEVAPGTGS